MSLPKQSEKSKWELEAQQKEKEKQTWVNAVKFHMIRIVEQEFTKRQVIDLPLYRGVLELTLGLAAKFGLGEDEEFDPDLKDAEFAAQFVLKHCVQQIENEQHPIVQELVRICRELE